MQCRIVLLLGNQFTACRAEIPTLNLSVLDTARGKIMGEICTPVNLCST